MRKSMKSERGQKIITDYPRDNSSHSLPGVASSAFGGGTGYLGHSIEGGVTAEQDGSSSNDKKNKFT